MPAAWIAALAGPLLALGAVLPASADAGERAYVIYGRGYELDLATRSGTFSITLGDGCGWVGPDVEVVVDTNAKPGLLMPDSDSGQADGPCRLASVALVDNWPCEQDAAGDCEIALADMAPARSGIPFM